LKKGGRPVQIDVFSSVGEVRSEELFGKTVIVIDVLRATSTMVTALAHGCAAIHPMETIGQARSAQQDGFILGGERFCKRIQGFDLGNSPLEYQPEIVKDRRIMMTTTNGTRAIHKSLRGETIIAGSFLNGTACARKVIQLRKDVVIVCSGTKDRFALEDSLCAGYLVQRIQDASPNVIITDDLGKAMRLAFSQASDRLAETLLLSESGKRLCRLGYQDDVLHCSRIDLYSNVPILRGTEPLELQND
jgi:2-phosphosulfolactate phosphatase